MASLRQTFLLLLLLPAFCWARQDPSRYPQQFEGDWNVPDFKFQSGETLAPLRLHYITLGSPARDADGRIRNAVLILHGTGGTGQNFLASEFGGELFGKGQPLDATRYYIILPRPPDLQSRGALEESPSRAAAHLRAPQQPAGAAQFGQSA
jgi:homoserine O-acetyltransferase